ncbi:hypothetical protein HPB51_006715 [Rhipicephalus microplus]|uniref:Uncharacterized protein n=1 Tax=Rhipicephalus microplus TaxID=6941 RepID=A0A9J6E6R8_RHIMP|nr:hypothetical protein HPB51_006715 [Rhipicephalus microplus]
MQQPRLVYPRLLEERSADGRMVMHLHDQLTLNLRKASVAARNFRVLEQEDGREVTHFEGVVGPRHRIEPVHTMERSEEGLIAHMIHEIEMKDMHDIAVAPIGKGIGYVGGLCTEYFVALGEDSAGLYTGMHTLTHECGHV